jgi:hypothetical protein
MAGDENPSTARAIHGLDRFSRDIGKDLGAAAFPSSGEIEPRM